MVVKMILWMFMKFILRMMILSGGGMILLDHSYTRSRWCVITELSLGNEDHGIAAFTSG